MMQGNEREFVETLLKGNRYLVLSTTDGARPWIAPLEYMIDEDLNLYFFSMEDSRHVADIEKNGSVAVTVFDRDQPDYSSDLSAPLHGVQIEATARRVPAGEYNEAIVAAIEALRPPMPPYAVFVIQPKHVYVPMIENGINVRSEVRI